MSVIAVGMVRDEEDLIAGTLLHLADEVDEIIVADNRSTDGTREILAELEDRIPLTVLDDPDVGYYQSHKMSHLARLAGEKGAEWVLPFDADELWLAEHKITKVLADCHGNVAAARLFNHLPTAVDPVMDDPFRSIVWRQQQPGAMPKVAFRWEEGATVHQGNHGVTLPHGERPEELLEIRHFPARSPEQFVRKARNGAQAYRATTLPQGEGAHWREWGDLLDRIGEEAFIEEVFMRHWHYMTPVENGLIHDPAPYRRWRSDASSLAEVPTDQASP